jgi:hypothetical protein
MISRKTAQRRLERRWHEQAERFPTMRNDLPMAQYVAANIEHVMRNDLLQRYDDVHDKPCASRGLTSYRARGTFGWIMIGATDAADAMREAQRSTPYPTDLQVWDGSWYVPVAYDAAMECEHGPDLIRER